MLNTNDILLAAFLACNGCVPKKKKVKSVDHFIFDLDENDPLVKQFENPDGYNSNVRRLCEKMLWLEDMELTA